MLTFFTTYTENKPPFKEVTDHKKIALHYLTGWFTIDFLSCIPFELIREEDPYGASELTTSLRCFRILKLFNLFRIFKLARLFKARENFGEEVVKSLQVSIAFTRLMVFLGYFLVLTHIAGCLFVYIGRMTSNADLTPWVVFADE